MNSGKKQGNGHTTEERILERWLEAEELPKKVVLLPESPELAAKLDELARNLEEQAAREPPAIITVGGVNEAKAYVPWIEPAEHAEPDTPTMEKVQVTKAVDPRQAVTEVVRLPVGSPASAHGKGLSEGGGVRRHRHRHRHRHRWGDECAGGDAARDADAGGDDRRVRRDGGRGRNVSSLLFSHRARAPRRAAAHCCIGAAIGGACCSSGALAGRRASVGVAVGVVARGAADVDTGVARGASSDAERRTCGALTRRGNVPSWIVITVGSGRRFFLRIEDVRPAAAPKAAAGAE